MHPGAARWPSYTAGIAVIVAAAITGCGANSSPTAGGGSARQAPASALDTVKLAAKTASSANSFTGTMDLRASVKPGAASSSGSVNMSASFAEQLRPSLLASVSISSLSAAGMSLPGGLNEIITPSTLYLKWSFLTQTLHLSKPWLAIPVSSIGKSSGLNLSQMLSQATNSDPLTQSQLLQGATSVRQVGTGNLNGLPVTEYTGTVPLDKGLTYLSGSAKAQVQQAMASAGLSTATFTVWIDGQHTVRKAVLTEVGKGLTETITTTITSINQPVNVTPPSAGQTSSLPAGDLSGLS